MSLDDFLIGFFIVLIVAGAAIKKLLATDTGKKAGLSLLDRWLK